jgi:hypothetical protein
MALSYLTNTKLTQSKLIAWYGLMQDEFDIVFIPKKESWLMKFFTFFISLARIFNKNICTPKEFMEDYTTTIYNRIYISYDIGSSPNYISEIFLIAHEVTHTLQFREERFLMPLKYLFSNVRRSEYETEAFLTHLELCHYLLLGAEDLKQQHYQDYIRKCMIELQANYGVSGTDLLEDEQWLQFRLERLNQDAYVLTEPSRLALGLLRNLDAY